MDGFFFGVFVLLLLITLVVMMIFRHTLLCAKRVIKFILCDA